MSIEQTEIVDGVGLEKGGSAVVMLISDHLPWDAAHITILQRKIEAYTDAALSGRLVGTYQAAKGKPVIIRILWRYEPPSDARAFLSMAQAQLADVGVKLEDRFLPFDS